MAFCSNCGTQIDENAAFCSSCGKPVEKESSQNQNQQQQNTQFYAPPAGGAPVSDQDDIEKNKIYAGFAYLLFFLPLVACPESKYARFHANQGLLVLLLGVGASIVIWILSAVALMAFSFAFLSIMGILGWIVSLGIIALAILGMINGFTGKVKELPLIGKIKIIK